MKTIVLLDRVADTLSPLTQDVPLALLPIAGKPLVEYTLESLVEAGIREALVIVGPHAEAVSLHLGRGERWGLILEYAFSRGDEKVPSLLQRVHAGVPDTELLVMRGDVLRQSSLVNFVGMARRSGRTVVHATVDGQALGLSYSQEGGASLSALNPDRLTQTVTEDSLPAEGFVNKLITLKDYYRANLDVAAGRIEGLRRAGREVAVGLRVGRHSVISPRTLVVGSAQIGNNCRIDPTVRLEGDVVISDNVIIDRQVHIENAVVLPESYVGEYVTIKDAIVRGNDLIDIDSGVSMKIVDAFLLTQLKSVPLVTVVSRVMQRVLGALLFILTLPLWLLAFLFAVLAHPRRPLLSCKLRGNRSIRGPNGQLERREFRVFEWNTRIRVLRKLPWLWSVLTGDLLLIGVEPVSVLDAKARQAEWERLADQVPAGLVGPTQLFISHRAPAEERLMSDAFFAGQTTPYKEWRLLFRAVWAIFEPRRWVMPTEARR